MPSEEKALYHNVVGAGRSRVTRKFLGLTEADKADIGQRIGQFVGGKLKAK